MDQTNPADTNLHPSDTASGVDNFENDGTGDMLRHGISGDTILLQEETKVIYHIDEEETPYKVTVKILFTHGSLIYSIL